MLRICLAVLASVMALMFGATAFAMEAILDSASDGGAIVHAVKSGDAFDIVGDCLDMARSSHDVRVVLSLAGKPDASNMGYSSVLATEQQLSDNSLRVRVPEMPEMNHHIFNVKVYALDRTIPSTCDAGQIRIS